MSMTGRRLRWLVIGRTATGKDTLSRVYASLGHTPCLSYTTRPRRDAADAGHMFVTPSEAASLGDRMAETTIADYVYFMTRELVDASDVIVIDPTGFWELLSRMPDDRFGLVYVRARDEVRRQRYAGRGQNGTPFDVRDASEDAQFTTFEQDVAAVAPHRIVCAIDFDNSSSDLTDIDRVARLMDSIARTFEGR